MSFGDSESGFQSTPPLEEERSACVGGALVVGVEIRLEPVEL